MGCRQQFRAEDCSPPFGEAVEREPKFSKPPWSESLLARALCLEFGVDPAGRSDAELHDRISEAVRYVGRGEERMLERVRWVMAIMAAGADAKAQAEERFAALICAAYGEAALRGTNPLLRDFSDVIWLDDQWPDDCF